MPAGKNKQPMRIQVVKQFRFEAAHRLPKYNGPCYYLHGHTYHLHVGVEGVVNDDTGFVTDFKHIKEMVKPLVTGLDHSFLNELDFSPSGIPFPKENPTAELMVEWFADVLDHEIRKAGHNIELSFVRLYETPDSYAEWRL